MKKKSRKNVPQTARPRKRPSWDEYFMAITGLAASRSTCLRRQIGSVITKGNRIVATGYNGSPSGMEHCLVLGCLRDEMNIPSGTRAEICRGLHAEQNALLFAKGADLAGGTLYCTNQPCVVCAKLIIQAGIRTVIYSNDYPDKLAMEFFRESGVETFKFVDGQRKRIR
jgi:dCMP deaminase